MPSATVFSRGRITLPRELCDELGIGPGTKLDFFENADGEMVMMPRRDDRHRAKYADNQDGSHGPLDR